MKANKWTKEIWTIPNLLSLFRLLLIPVYVYIYLNAGDNVVNYYIAAAILAVSCLTDMIDGQIARRFHMITNLGKILDPLADKVLVLAAMCFFVENGQMPGWVVAIVLFREFAVSGLRLIAVEQSRVIAAAWSGKIKTASTMVGLCAMMLFSGNSLVNLICTVVILLTTVYSGVEYFWVNRDVFKDVN